MFLLLDYPAVACSTTSGEDPNKPCVFPFIFKGITYNWCTKDGNESGDTEAWCATKVDGSGEYERGTTNWGFCEPKCQPKHDSSLLGWVRYEIQATWYK